MESLKKNFIFLSQPPLPPPNQVSGSVTDTDPGYDVSRSTLLRLAQDVMLLDPLMTLAWMRWPLLKKYIDVLEAPPPKKQQFTTCAKFNINYHQNELRGSG